MPQSGTDLARKIKDIVHHVRPLSDEARAPILHFARTRSDLGHLRQFLNEIAANCNQRIGQRLAQLLSAIYLPTPSTPTPQALADCLAAIFRLPLQVATAVGDVPPD